MNDDLKRKKLPVERAPLPRGSHASLFERRPVSRTIAGKVSKKVTLKVMSGKWNDGGR
jgi:hypothetical protein